MPPASASLLLVTALLPFGWPLPGPPRAWQHKPSAPPPLEPRHALVLPLPGSLLPWPTLHSRTGRTSRQCATQGPNLNASLHHPCHQRRLRDGTAHVDPLLLQASARRVRSLTPGSPLHHHHCPLPRQATQPRPRPRPLPLAVPRWQEMSSLLHHHRPHRRVRRQPVSQW